MFKSVVSHRCLTTTVHMFKSVVSHRCLATRVHMFKAVVSHRWLATIVHMFKSVVSHRCLTTTVHMFKSVVSHRCLTTRPVWWSIPEVGWLAGWLLTVPATCMCISGRDLLRRLHVLPRWDRSCRSNFPSHPLTVYWHWANQSQRWPYNASRLAG